MLVCACAPVPVMFGPARCARLLFTWRLSPHRVTLTHAFEPQSGSSEHRRDSDAAAPVRLCLLYWDYWDCYWRGRGGGTWLAALCAQCQGEVISLTVVVFYWERGQLPRSVVWVMRALCHIPVRLGMCAFICRSLDHLRNQILNRCGRPAAFNPRVGWHCESIFIGV